MKGEYVVVLGIIHTCIALRYSDAIECWISTQETLVRSSAGAKGDKHFFHLLHFDSDYDISSSLLSLNMKIMSLGHLYLCTDTCFFFWSFIIVTFFPVTLFPVTFFP